MKDRTINVSNNRPMPMVVPTCPMTTRSLTAIDINFTVALAYREP